MHLLVNALSIGSMSGQHVVYGFLRPLASAWQGTHKITVLHTEKEKLPTDLRDAGVDSYEVSGALSHWLKRTAWEVRALPKIIQQLKANVVLTASGALLPRCPVPQAVLCQNPWCYVPAAQRGFKERFKAWLQRLGYAKAFKQADLMIYISNHLRELYQRDNRGHQEKKWSVAYVGIDNDTFTAAQELANEPRIPKSILSVSAMARWKGAHTLIEAIAMLKKQGEPCTLSLVGPWPEATYRQEMDKRIEDANLQESVKIYGRVDDDQLHRMYATHEIFCLMSECESFGIPAAEAMTFGTPIVSTNCCAISEICESAGLFGPANDPAWTAQTLKNLLNDRFLLQQHSLSAKNRANTLLRWNHCFRPLLQLSELAA